MTLRSGTAAGPVELPAEDIKADIETAVNMRYSLFSKLPEMETLGTAATIEGSCSCQRLAKFSTGYYWKRSRRLSTPSSETCRQAFLRNRPCADQIASLCIIVEQSLEWNPPPSPPHPLYISFIGYQKAFHGVDRETMWKLLRHYGVP